MVMRLHPTRTTEEADEEKKSKLYILEDETPTPKEAVGGLLMGLGYLSIFVLVIYYPLFWLLRNSGISVDVISTAAQIITGLIVIILMMTVISRRTKAAISRGFTHHNILVGLISGAVMYGVEIVVSLVLTAIYGDTINNANQTSLDALAKESPLIFILLVCLVAPVIEELIFRYYLYKPLENTHRWWHLDANAELSTSQRRVNFVIALVISTVLFSAIHLSSSLLSHTLATDIKTLPLYLIPSLLFGIMYYKTKHVATPIITHITYNCITAALMFLSNEIVSSSGAEITALIARIFG